MSTFAQSFKSEVTRLARKEAKAAVAPIRKPSGANRSALADLKRRVAALEKENRRFSDLLETLSPLRLCASARRTRRKLVRESGKLYAAGGSEVDPDPDSDSDLDEIKPLSGEGDRYA